jgi:hypothetical protein
MGIFTPRPDQWKRLNAIGSVPMYTWQSNKCTCLLQDVATKKVWHSGKGITALDAIDDALETAGSAPKPMTTAELAQETMSQTQKITELEAQLENLKDGDGASKPTRFMEDASIYSGRKKKRRRRSATTSTDTETETK